MARQCAASSAQSRAMPYSRILPFCLQTREEPNASGTGLRGASPAVAVELVQIDCGRTAVAAKMPSTAFLNSRREIL